MLAVMNGHRDSVMLLLDQAANPNAVDVNGRTSAHRGVSIQFSFYSRHFTHFLPCVLLDGCLFIKVEIKDLKMI